MADHEVNPKVTAVLSVDRTQHVCPCAIFHSASPLTFFFRAAMYLLHGDGATTAQEQVRHKSRSAPSDQISTIEACERRSRTE